MLLLCWSGGASEHGPNETSRLLSCGSSLLQFKLGVSKSHSNIWILRSERVSLRFRGVHPLNQMPKGTGIAGALEAMSGSLVFMAVYLTRVFCHQGPWLKAGKLLGHQTLSAQFVPVVGGEEDPKPSGSGGVVQHMWSTCHWLLGEGAAKKETLLFPSNAVLFKGFETLGNFKGFETLEIPTGRQGRRKIVNGNKYSQILTDLRWMPKPSSGAQGCAQQNGWG